MVVNRGRVLQVRQPNYDIDYKTRVNNLFHPTVDDIPFPNKPKDWGIQSMSYEVSPIEWTDFRSQRLQIQENEREIKARENEVNKNNSRDFEAESKQEMENISTWFWGSSIIKNSSSGLSPKQQAALETYQKSRLRLDLPKWEFYGQYDAKKGVAKKYWVNGDYIYETEIDLNHPGKKNDAKVYLKTEDNLNELQKWFDRININRIIQQEKRKEERWKKILTLGEIVDKLPDYEIKLKKPAFRK